MKGGGGFGRPWSGAEGYTWHGGHRRVPCGDRHVVWTPSGSKASTNGPKREANEADR
jgi:hypothetical protein